MRIGIDIDDTITFTNEYLIEQALLYDEKYVKGKGFKDRKAYNFLEMFYWSCFDVDNFFKYVRNNNFYAYVSPKEDAIKYINKLYDEGNEIYFVTRRKSTLKIKHITKKWLKKNNVKYHKLIMDSKLKGISCLENKIDIFIDNEEENIKNAVDNNINSILYGTEYNKESKYNRIDKWVDIYKYIKEVK